LKNILTVCFTVLIATTAVGCAKGLPAPGGTTNTNEYTYKDRHDFLNKVGTIKPGMTEEEVFASLEHDKDEFLTLEKEQIVKSLYGSSEIVGNYEDEHGKSIEGKKLLLSLYGYRLHYKLIKRSHGFSSPIRVSTKETGFEYTLSLIFRKGKLYSDPIITGGKVNKTSSHTLFEYLTPGNIVNNAVD